MCGKPYFGPCMPPVQLPRSPIIVQMLAEHVNPEAANSPPALQPAAHR